MDQTKKTKIYISRNPSLIDALLQLNVFSKVISPGSLNPFDFNMLQNVEECFQFKACGDIDPSVIQSFQDGKGGSLRFTFFSLVKNLGWILVKSISTDIVAQFSGILITILTEKLINHIENQMFEAKTLIWLSIEIGILRIVQSFSFTIYVSKIFSVDCFTQNSIKVSQNKFRSKNDRVDILNH